MTVVVGPAHKREASAEARRIRFAIDTALDANEPDFLFFHFRDELWKARTNGLISLGEWSGLSRYVEIQWWDGRNLPDREDVGDC